MSDQQYPYGQPGPQQNQGQPQQPAGQPGPQQNQGQPQQPAGQPGPQQPAGQPAQQTPYGQPAAQQNFGQPAGQPAQQTPYGQPAQPQQQFGQPVQPQQQFSQPAGQPAQQFGQPAPKKKGNTGLIIGLIIAAVVVIGGIIAIFASGVFSTAKGGYDSPEAPIKAFFEAFNKRDSEALRATFPADMSEDADKDLSDMLDDINSADESIVLDVDSADYSDAKHLTKSEWSKYGSGIQDAYEYNVDITLTQDYMGTTITAVEPCKFVTIKWKKKWFNIYVKLDQDNIEVTDYGDFNDLMNTDDDADEDTEADTEEETTEEATVTSTGSADLWSNTLNIDGTDYTFPFDYNTVKEPLHLDLSGTDGLTEDTMIDARCTSDGYNTDDTYTNYSYFSNGNTSDEEKALKDCPITVFSADVYGDDASGAMQVVFPGGITWFSTVDEVEAAYGTPQDDSLSDYNKITYEDENGNEYEFTFNDDGKMNSFWIYFSTYAN